MRSTSVKDTLLSLLEKERQPLSAPAIVEWFARAGKGVNKTSIYRAIEYGIASGVIAEVLIDGTCRYFELADRAHHHHAICTQCGAVEDISFDDESIIESVKKQKALKGFVIQRHSMDFFGLCKKCNV